MVFAALAGGVLFAPAARAGAPSWVGLEQGQIGPYQWSVKAGTPVAGGQPRYPCLMIGTAWERNVWSLQRSHYRTCSESRGLAASEAPVVAIGVQPSTGAPVGMTAVGVITAPGVSRLRATLRDGSTETISTHRLTAVQARSARVGQLRYAAFAVRGWWCAERLVTLDAAGRTLWDSGVDEYRCSADGSPEGAPVFQE